MFIEQQPIENLERGQLADRAGRMKAEGFRLVHVCANTLADAVEISYAFDLGNTLRNLRVVVPKTDPRVPSISSHYLAAFPYENELQDLFGLAVDGLVLDFKGQFYKKAHPKPFNPDQTAAPASPAPAAK